MEPFWTFRCSSARQAQGILYIVQSKQNVKFSLQFEQKLLHHPPFHYTITTAVTATATTTSTALHYTALQYTALITLKKICFTSPHGITLSCITPELQLQLQLQLNYTTLHSTALITLNDTSLHCTALSYITPDLQLQLQLHYTTLHYSTLHSSTLHSSTLQ